PIAPALERYWISAHAVSTIVLIVTLVLNWKAPRRRALILAVLGAYLVTRVWTFLDFLPELAAFTATPPEGPFSPDLAARAWRWASLSWVRVAMGFLNYALLGFALIPPSRRLGSPTSMVTDVVP